MGKQTGVDLSLLNFTEIQKIAVHSFKLKKEKEKGEKKNLFYSLQYSDKSFKFDHSLWSVLCLASRTECCNYCIDIFTDAKK